MSLILKDIYNETKNIYELRLICGESGLNRLMDWVYVTEDMTNFDFLKGGELIITTGVSSSYADSPACWLHAFISAVVEQDVCGVILNTGKYLHEEDITEEIRLLCEEHSFPLLTMPWHIHIFDITHDYYSRIFYGTQSELMINNAFLNLIYERPDTALNQRILEEHGYPASAPYRVCCLSYRSRKSGTETSPAAPAGSTGSDNNQRQPTVWKEKIRFHLERFLISWPGIRLCLTEQYCLLVIPCGPYPNFRDIIDAMIDHMLLRCPELLFYAGIGSQADSFARLPVSCRHALTVSSIAVNRSVPACYFDDLGFLKVLLCVRNRAILDRYIEEKLGAVLAYDREHQTAYTETLQKYLEHQGSVQKIAADLYCHRNTVNYRIRVLKNELGFQLDDSHECFTLMAAFEMREYLRMLPAENAKK